MTNRVRLLVGTKKGAFILESDEKRVDWSVRGPMCEGWPVHDMIVEPKTGAILVANFGDGTVAAFRRSGPSFIGETSFGAATFPVPAAVSAMSVRRGEAISATRVALHSTRTSLHRIFAVSS